MKGEWQPIETAPKDGSAILLLTETGHACSGQWIKAEPDGQDYMGHDAGWMSDCAMTVPGRSFGNPEYRMDPIDPPTHWMPLPEPPND